jgi:hypothetical protein
MGDAATFMVKRLDLSNRHGNDLKMRGL